jgi:hypothetical protein
MSRIWVGFMGVKHWQHDTKESAAAEFRLRFDNTAVGMNNTSGNAQAKASAICLGGEKWVKEPRLEFRWNSLAGVVDLESHSTAFLAAGTQDSRTRAQGDRSAAANTFSGVFHKVEHRLFDLVWVSVNLSACLKVGREFDFSLAQRRLKQFAQRPQRGLDAHPLEGGFRRPGELKCLDKDGFEPVNFFVNKAIVFQARRLLAQNAALCEKPRLNGV